MQTMAVTLHAVNSNNHRSIAAILYDAVTLVED